MGYVDVSFFKELEQRVLPSPASLNSLTPERLPAVDVFVSWRPSKNDTVWIFLACWHLEQLHHLNK